MLKLIFGLLMVSIPIFSGYDNKKLAWFSQILSLSFLSLATVVLLYTMYYVKTYSYFTVVDQTMFGMITQMGQLVIVLCVDVVLLLAFILKIHFWLRRRKQERSQTAC